MYKSVVKTCHFQKIVKKTSVGNHFNTIIFFQFNIESSKNKPNKIGIYFSKGN